MKGSSTRITFYSWKYLGDPALSLCSPATRAIWFDLYCILKNKEIGTISGPVIGMARICRCSLKEFLRAIEELEPLGLITLVKDLIPGSSEYIYTVKSRLDLAGRD